MTTITANDGASDAELLDLAAATISVPRVEQGDSFILHAPLEVLARSALLALAVPGARDAIRDRIATVAVTYADWGTPIDRPPHHGSPSPTGPDGMLIQALATGDSEAADDAINSLTARLDTQDLVRVLAGPLLPSLAAAAHGPIFVYLLPRVAARSLPAATMARTAVHELARHPDRRLSWFEAPNAETPIAEPEVSTELIRRLARPHLSERPDNQFIYPTMAAVERSGLAGETLGDLIPNLTVTAARHCLLRIAAHSMLQDDPANAPYGWSHCLTMPQAALGIANATDDPQVATAVAATYVLGFRATLAAVTIDPEYIPEPVRLETPDLLDASPSAAAAAAWHSPPGDHPTIWATLTSNAGAHHDAHLAKYTLACLDATRGDPSHHHLYRAAAAYLNAWWQQQEQ